MTKASAVAAFLAVVISASAFSPALDAQSRSGRRKVMSGKDMKCKLGVLHIRTTENMKKLVDAGCMPILKISRRNLELGIQAKKKHPDMILVTWVDGKNFKTSNPAKEEAEARWKNFKDQLEQIPEEHRKLIDFVELWPCMWIPKDEKDARWSCEYAEIIVPRVAKMGLRPVVLTAGVGGLPTQGGVLEELVPMLKLAKEHGGAWSCHGYTLNYTKNVGEEVHLSLRYRLAYDYFRQRHPDLLDLPMIMTEGGVDHRGDPKKDGWQARGTKEKFQDWLAWYDGELMKDEYVLGVTLFQMGDDHWSSFNIDPVAPWLLEYCRARKPKGVARRSPRRAAEPAPAGAPSRWRKVASVKGNTKQTFTASFPAVKAKGVRLRITRCSSREGNDRARLGEALVFGPDGLVFPSSCVADATEAGYNPRAVCDGDEGFSEGGRKRGWASPVGKPDAEHWIYLEFKSPKEIFQVRITTAEAEKDRVRDLVLEIPVN